MIWKKRNRKHASLAAIEYHGIPGITQKCLDAVMRLIQWTDHVAKVLILTNSNTHCLLLTVNDGELIAIKSGFRSGFTGEGPRGLSYVIQLLGAHGAEIAEFDVRRDFIDRVDSSCLTIHDLKYLEAACPVQPPRLADYLAAGELQLDLKGKIWCEFPNVIPYAAIDYRIVDIAKSFLSSPDKSLLDGYRRLEEIVRKRTGLDEHGINLFAKAFLGKERKLEWKSTAEHESAGRAELFRASFLAYRNPRAHKEKDSSPQGAFLEFLLLNHLYHLEREAVDCPEADSRIVSG